MIVPSKIEIDLTIRKYGEETHPFKYPRSKGDEELELLEELKFKSLFAGEAIRKILNYIGL